MTDDVYPWDDCYEQPAIEEEDFDLDVQDEHHPCHECAFYESILCEVCIYPTLD